MDTTKFKNYFSEFKELYESRPIQDNTGGMKSSHLFAFYCAMKELQPNLVVESGIWKGQGTWFIRKALPDADIMSFDIDLSLMEYKSDEVQYLETDINTIDWEEFFKDNPEKTPEKTLLFLDDHQDFSDRLYFLDDAPFKHVVVEDNYPPSQGDIISPKKINEGGNYVIDKHGVRNEFELHSSIKKKFDDKVESYIELPPLYILEKTRWGDDWENEKYKTPDPIFTNEEIVDESYYTDCYDYTWMCYIKIKD
tara:strand:- start:466 stop:1221 length:756 start_codon:yes stop_codon:yes gene_type:complete